MDKFVIIFATFVSLLFTSECGLSAFVCTTDGHFGDDNDCTKYYHCANGRALAGACPNGLFWNQGRFIFLILIISHGW